MRHNHGILGILCAILIMGVVLSVVSAEDHRESKGYSAPKVHVIAHTDHQHHQSSEHHSGLHHAIDIDRDIEFHLHKADADTLFEMCIANHKDPNHHLIHADIDHRYLMKFGCPTSSHGHGSSGGNHVGHNEGEHDEDMGHDSMPGHHHP